MSIAALALIYGVAEAFAAHGTIYAAAGTSYGGFKGKIAGLPVEFVVLLAITALAQFILSFTVFGRNLFLLGASFRAAETVGVRTWRAITGAYLWAGLFTAAAGIMRPLRCRQHELWRRLRIRRHRSGAGRRHRHQGGEGSAVARSPAR